MVEESGTFRDWTPQMLEALKDGRKNRGPWSSGARRNHMAALESRTLEENIELNKKRSEGHKRYLETLTPEEKEERLKHSFRSSEAQAKALSHNHFKDPEVQKMLAEKRREVRANMTEEEKKKWVDRSILSVKGKENQKRFFLNESKEAKLLRLRSTFHSDEAIRKSRIASRARPTVLERLVGWYLDKNFPGRYKYNGDCSLGVVIGGKIPDFVAITGGKEVIEVLGGLGFFHFWGDEEKLIEHYTKFGYKCLIVWEWDIWAPGRLDKIFGTVTLAAGVL